MADPITTEPNSEREITLQLGSQGTAFTLGLLAGVIAGVVASLCIFNYARK